MKSIALKETLFGFPSNPLKLRFQSTIQKQMIYLVSNSKTKKKEIFQFYILLQSHDAIQKKKKKIGQPLNTKKRRSLFHLSFYYITTTHLSSIHQEYEVCHFVFIVAVFPKLIWKKFLIRNYANYTGFCIYRCVTSWVIWRVIIILTKRRLLSILYKLRIKRIKLRLTSKFSVINRNDARRLFII